MAKNHCLLLFPGLNLGPKVPRDMMLRARPDGIPMATYTGARPCGSAPLALISWHDGSASCHKSAGWPELMRSAPAIIEAPHEKRYGAADILGLRGEESPAAVVLPIFASPERSTLPWSASALRVTLTRRGASLSSSWARRLRVRPEVKGKGQ